MFPNGHEDSSPEIPPFTLTITGLAWAVLVNCCLPGLPHSIGILPRLGLFTTEGPPRASQCRFEGPHGLARKEAAGRPARASRMRPDKRIALSFQNEALVGQKARLPPLVAARPASERGRRPPIRLGLRLRCRGARHGPGCLPRAAAGLHRRYDAVPLHVQRRARAR